MKIVYSILFVASFWVFSQSTVSAQDMPKRYATVELFTNTPCPICVSNNPAFFNLLGNYSSDVHQISFYPGRPYSSCPIYQDNTSENTYWNDFRNNFSTPRVFIDGGNSMSSASVDAADLDAVTGGESFLYVRVDETGSTSRNVSVQLQTFDVPTTNTGNLYVAVVEREVLLTGIPSNWEERHHNVFRQFVTPQTGMSVDLTLDDQTLMFNYTVDPSWNENDIYVLAWVQNPNTDAVYNSGTRFDELFSSTEAFEAGVADIRLYPNPVSDRIQLQIPAATNIERIAVLDIVGKEVAQFLSTENMSVRHLARGNYSLVISTASGAKQTLRFVKQ